MSRPEQHSRSVTFSFGTSYSSDSESEEQEVAGEFERQLKNIIPPHHHYATNLLGPLVSMYMHSAHKASIVVDELVVSWKQDLTTGDRIVTMEFSWEE